MGTTTTFGELGGPAAPSAREELARTWAAVSADPSATTAELTTAGVELCKLGDFTPRAGLLAALLPQEAMDHLLGHDRQAVLDHVRLQHVVFLVARSSDVDDPRLREYLGRTDGEAFLQVAASAHRLAARSALPLYLDIVAAFPEMTGDWWEAAIDGGSWLSGEEFDRYDDEADVAEWAARARAALASVDADYVSSGAPLHPRPDLDLVTELLHLSVTKGGRLVGRGLLEDIATTSGVAAPVIPEGPASAETAALVTEYVERVSGLPWRPGVKYFYGHDVDGGPGLSEPRQS